MKTLVFIGTCHSNAMCARLFWHSVVRLFAQVTFKTEGFLKALAELVHLTLVVAALLSHPRSPILVFTEISVDACCRLLWLVARLWGFSMQLGGALSKGWVPKVEDQAGTIQAPNLH